MMACNMQPSAQEVDPTKHPKVKLGDKEYEVKFRLSDVSRLWKEHQIDLFTSTEVKGIEAIQRVSKILAAGIANSGDALTWEDVELNIEMGEVPIYMLACVEAQKKASKEAQKALEALQKMAPKKAPKQADDTSVQ